MFSTNVVRKREIAEYTMLRTKQMASQTPYRTVDNATQKWRRWRGDELGLDPGNEPGD